MAGYSYHLFTIFLRHCYSSLRQKVFIRYMRMHRPKAQSMQCMSSAVKNMNKYQQKTKLNYAFVARRCIWRCQSSGARMEHIIKSKELLYSFILLVITEIRETNRIINKTDNALQWPWWWWRRQRLQTDILFSLLSPFFFPCFIHTRKQRLIVIWKDPRIDRIL